MKYSGNQLAMRTLMARALSFSAVAALTLNPLLTPALAADEPVLAPVGEQAPMVSPVATVGSTKVRFLALGIGKSVIIDLPREVKDVLVADPKIANAVVRSAQRAYIIGAAVGQTNVVFFDAAGQQVAAYDIAVKRDLNGVRAALRHTAGNPDRGRRRRRHADRLGIHADRGAAGGRSRGAAGRRCRQGRQLDRRQGPRSGDAEGHGRGSAAGHRQADGRRSQRQHELRHHDREIQQCQPVHRKQRTAGPGQRAWRVVRLDAIGPGDASRDGKRRRRADARRTQSDGDLRQVRDIYLGRRISHSDRRDLPTDSGRRYRTMRSDRQLQEIRHLAQLHAGGAERGADQPAGDDRSVGSLDRKRFDRRCRWNDDSLHQDPSCRNHARDPLRRLDGDGRPDPGKDQAGGQRNSRPRTPCPSLARCSGARISSTTRPN